MLRLSGHIMVIAVGKLRRSHWLTAQEKYQKRLQRYTDFQLVEVKDVVGRGVSDAVAKQRESDTVLSTAVSAHYKIALTPTGKTMTSPQLAQFLQTRVELYGRLVFLIGGPLGFTTEAIARCDAKLSLSPLTFPHEMARIILLEQLYRACTILNNEKYHK